MIIPAYNEEESIFDTVMSILNYRKKVDFDLDYVVINDGSTDKTKQILEEPLQVRRLWINIEELSNGFLKKTLIQI